MCIIAFVVGWLMFANGDDGVVAVVILAGVAVFDAEYAVDDEENHMFSFRSHFQIRQQMAN